VRSIAAEVGPSHISVHTLEVGQLLAAADEWFRPFVALCAFAGLRLARRQHYNSAT
jgi:hypothetical protein